tara:strand:+ start:631 stop:783 length:153 start_codon:yes stop_codon:yes gene_type:complete
MVRDMLALDPGDWGLMSAKTGFEFGDVEVEFGKRGWKENMEREASDTTAG